MTTEEYKEIGQTIQNERKARDLSQQSVADQLGITRHALKQIEDGDSPQLGNEELMGKLAELLEIPPACLGVMTAREKYEKKVRETIEITGADIRKYVLRMAEPELEDVISKLNVGGDGQTVSEHICMAWLAKAKEVDVRTIILHSMNSDPNLNGMIHDLLFESKVSMEMAKWKPQQELPFDDANDETEETEDE